MTERVLIKDLKEYVGHEATIQGWVSVRRDHGKIVFFEMRDRSGSVQTVIVPSNAAAYEPSVPVRSEWVLEMKGLVKERPEKMRKEGLNGNLEMEAVEISILNTSETPPFDLSTDGKEVGEERRMEYRYLDLRRERMQKAISTRHRVIKYLRDRLDEKGFYEIETPILTKSTPEGARDYLVPSRVYQGKFYALPQSPQQYKQLLMVAGMEKYFQVARCFRDEDTRGDRQPEFTQLDMEMSFVNREDVMALNEGLLIGIVKAVAPEKKIQQVPFPRLTYQEAMEKYGTDRPDLRENKDDPNLLAFCWVIDFPFFEKTPQGGWTFTHNPFSRPVPQHEPWLMNKEKISEILTTQYDVALNGFEIAGGSIRNHRPEALEKVFEIMGFEKDKIYANFGHMLEALSFGAPPHGGIAWGLDRFVALILGETSIREVIAFPKTGEGRDLMMHAPSDVSAEQLVELGISIKKQG